MNHEIPSPVLDVLRRKFNVLEHMNFLEFDHDFDRFKQRLNDCRKPQFDARDRIIVEHLDTDYYFDHCLVGVNFRNFFWGHPRNGHTLQLLHIVYQSLWYHARNRPIVCSY